MEAKRFLCYINNDWLSKLYIYVIFNNEYLQDNYLLNDYTYDYQDRITIDDDFYINDKVFNIEKIDISIFDRKNSHKVPVQIINNGKYELASIVIDLKNHVPDKNELFYIIIHELEHINYMLFNNQSFEYINSENLISKYFEDDKPLSEEDYNILSMLIDTKTPIPERERLIK